MIFLFKNEFTTPENGCDVQGVCIIIITFYDLYRVFQYPFLYQLSRPKRFFDPDNVIVVEVFTPLPYTLLDFNPGTTGDDITTLLLLPNGPFLP